MKNVMQQSSAGKSAAAASTATAAQTISSTTAKGSASATSSTAAVQPQQQAVKPPYKGLLHTATTIIQEEGILALYKGSIPALMLVSHGGIQFVTYEFLKGHFISYFPTTKSSGGSRSNGGSGRGRHEGTIRERARDSLGYLVMGAVSKL